jgi:hypothetical protein
MTLSQISVYEPACLVVGTRGRSLGGIQGILPGSVSKYCLQNSPVPVIVVRDSRKRERKKAKRRADPRRRTYLDILETSGATNGSMLEKLGHEGPTGDRGKQNEREAMEVAKAIGLPATYAEIVTASTVTVSSSRIAIPKSEGFSGPESPILTGPMVSDPTIPQLLSPEVTDVESAEEEEGQGKIVQTQAGGQGCETPSPREYVEITDEISLELKGSNDGGL